MPELDGLDAAQQILKTAPQTEILILPLHDFPPAGSRRARSRRGTEVAIAPEFGLSSVENYRASIGRKLGLRRTTELAGYGIRQNIISP